MIHITNIAVAILIAVVIWLPLALVTGDRITPRTFITPVAFAVVYYAIWLWRN